MTTDPYAFSWPRIALSGKFHWHDGGQSSAQIHQAGGLTTVPTRALLIVLTAARAELDVAMAVSADETADGLAAAEWADTLQRALVEIGRVMRDARIAAERRES